MWYIKNKNMSFLKTILGIFAFTKTVDFLEKSTRSPITEDYIKEKYKDQFDDLDKKQRVRRKREYRYEDWPGYTKEKQGEWELLLMDKYSVEYVSDCWKPENDLKFKQYCATVNSHPEKYYNLEQWSGVILQRIHSKKQDADIKLEFKTDKMEEEIQSLLEKYEDTENKSYERKADKLSKERDILLEKINSFDDWWEWYSTDHYDNMIWPQIECKYKHLFK
jgi:hypothetical protein